MDMNTFGFISLFSRSWYIFRLERNSPTLQGKAMVDREGRGVRGGGKGVQ